ncbi:MAG: polyprenyl synthetase family protein [Proteobacteria bacterium]|nr:polyprenyl synthetase family protein [Pseudomonadota bacterium]
MGHGAQTRLDGILPVWQQGYAELQGFYQEQGTPLGDAITYVLAKPGKQHRAILTLLSCDLLDQGVRRALGVAQAIELIHAYSLIHDDLPAMDNADTRRGQPSLHKAMDETTAILAGDALLTDAFSWLVKTCPSSWGAATLCRMIDIITELTGSHGMVLGQLYDSHNPDIQTLLSAKSWVLVSREELNTILARLPAPLHLPAVINLYKTGALFASCLVMGFLAGGGESLLRCDTIKVLRLVGFKLGLVYQMVDDVRDMSSDYGKPALRDHDLDKNTMPRIISSREVMAFAGQMLNRACQDLLTQDLAGPVARDKLENLVWYINQMLPELRVSET